MKKLSPLFLIFIGILIGNPILAQTESTPTTHEEMVNAQFKVYGNCEMCKKRIETAALSVEGVTKAEWDVDSKILTVTYSDPAFAKHNNSVDAISDAIAAAGHDTQFKNADDNAYRELPGCCQYERKSSKNPK